MNLIAISGNLCRDPESKDLPSGIKVATFTIAVSRYKDGADFFDVEAFGKSADYVMKYAHKGTLCEACGRMESREWTDRGGAKRIQWTVKADSVNVRDLKRDEYPSIGEAKPKPRTEPKPQAFADDDDMPF